MAAARTALWPGAAARRATEGRGARGMVRYGERETETERESERGVCDKILIWTRDMDGRWRLGPGCVASRAPEFMLTSVASLRASDVQCSTCTLGVCAVGPRCLCNRPCEVTPTYLPTWLYGHYSSKRGAWHKILRRAQFRRRIKAIRMRTLPTWNRSTRTLTVNVKTSPLAYTHGTLNSLLCNA